MTRIATFGQFQMLLQNVLQNELRVFEGERKLSSGIRSRDYKGMARDVNTLAGAKTLLSSTEGYIKDNNEVSRRLELYDLNSNRCATSLRGFATIPCRRSTAIPGSLTETRSTAISIRP